MPRLNGRADHPFGRQPGDVELVLAYHRRLRAEAIAAGAVAIDASQPIDAVVADILALVG